MEKYFKDLQNQVQAIYSIAENARSKGLDPVNKVEIPLAMSLGEKAIGLISTIYPQLGDRRIVNRILELEKKYGKLDVAVSFKIAEEIAKQKYCKFESLIQAIDAGIRVGFAYNTLGVVSSPIEGFTALKLEKTRDGKEYFKAYFSGPIRSAGTTASCVALMLIDYLRELFGYAKYDPTEEEIKRYVTENFDYHERITNLQYLPTEEEIIFLAKNMPIQIAGEPTEKLEVSNYKDLGRVETNFIRGGMCLIFSEGLAQKAQKGLRLLNGVKSKGFQSSGWDFLEEYIVLHKKREKGSTSSSPTYLKDLVAGRPVFGHPSRSGAFRFRYGRTRSCGFSAASVHPATMAITDSFLSSGTQLKVEKPTKGCALTSCDGIDGPVVKLFNGSVKRLKDFEEARRLYSETEEILYLGDILFPFGDVLNRNYNLLKQGYVEEWWGLELKKSLGEKKLKLDFFDVDFEKAVEYSREYNVPLHPNYIFYWTEISKEQFFELVEWLKHGVWREKIVLPYGKLSREKYHEAKRALELLGVEHELFLDNVIVGDDSQAFLLNLGVEVPDSEVELKESIEKIKIFDKSVLEIVNENSEFIIKDKAGTFIGSRMGRPEKAKPRKLIGNPHVLFPVGNEGGRMRSFQEAVSTGYVKGDFPIYLCEKCNKETIYYICEECGTQTKKLNFCRECKRTFTSEKCPIHNIGTPYSNRKIDIKHFFESASKKLGMGREEIPVLVKGVRGTSSEAHSIENLAKGFLRAQFSLPVNKDGTIRLDATELPLTHFKPREISTSVEKLRELGYIKDLNGKQLESDDQILELRPHDILLPSCPDSLDEKADEFFLRVGNFIDSLLFRFYGMKPFYNLKKREDLVGHLAACMSPHNCAGVVSRIIGFSKTQSLTASPFMHAAMRRDCDGDEAAVMLLMDVLLNFSRRFLPAHRGGTQDAPLVLNAKIQAGEVDDQILDFEIGEYPLELYELSELRKHSSEVKIETIKDRLKEGKDPFVKLGFTHDCSDFNLGVVNSSYKTLPTMKDKVGRQMDLVVKLRAVDPSDVARLVIERHFIRDIRGNLRKFSMQGFRCVGCNEKFRRPPLQGTCIKCNGKIIFTIHEGGIIKYLEPAIELAKTYNVSSYIQQSLDLTKMYIESVFGKEKEKQVALAKWF